MLASVVMGALFGWQRKVTGGIQAPVLTHLVWSALMLRYLPPLFDDQLSIEVPRAPGRVRGQRQRIDMTSPATMAPKPIAKFQADSETMNGIWSPAT